MFFAMLMAAATCMKHRGFIEEREWRVIYSPLVPGMYSEFIEQRTEFINGIPQLVQKLPIDARVPQAADIDFARTFDHLIMGRASFRYPSRTLAWSHSSALAFLIRACGSSSQTSQFAPRLSPARR